MSNETTLVALRQALPQLQLSAEEVLTERRMFGGVCYLLNGKMLAGVAKSLLVIRLEEAEFAAASQSGSVTPMDFTGRPLRGFAYVAPEAFSGEEELLAWLEMSLRYVRKLMLPRRS